MKQVGNTILAKGVNHILAKRDNSAWPKGAKLSGFSTIYTIRYFQHDGKGSLRMENGTVFQPNDRYLLENEKFRLYYTSASTETQTLTVVVEDNFGKSYEMEFSFNDTDEEEEFARSANKLGSV